MKDLLGDRMKGHEVVWNHTLIKRMPVILRLDGKAFHSFLSKIKKTDPFSDDVHELMFGTMSHLCENIQNAVLGYTQSDEISILLNDWKQFETQQWFRGGQSKMESIAASMATGKFNSLNHKLFHPPLGSAEFAMFDCRAFNVPKEDVNNYFIWRQKDAIRNSVNALGQHYYSTKQLSGKKVDAVKELLLREKNVDWNALYPWKRHGVVWTKGVGVDLHGHVATFMDDRTTVDKLLE